MNNDPPPLCSGSPAPPAETDPELAGAISDELTRQQDGIELIASETAVSAAVLEAQGSVLTDRYAEGYPGRRYGGCAYVDAAEQLAVAEALAFLHRLPGRRG